MIYKFPLNYAINISRNGLRYFGCWHVQNPSFWNNMLYGVWAFLAYMFMLGFYVLIQTIHMIVHWGDVDQMMGALFLLLTNILHSFKIINCLRRSPEYDKIINRSLEWKSEAKTRKDLDIIQRYERNSFINMLVYFSTATTCIIGWALVPVVDHKISGDSRVLPLHAWYPYDKFATPAYEISYSHQVVAILLAAYGDMMHDVLMGNLMGLASCHLELLMSRLEQLAYDEENNTVLTLWDADDQRQNSEAAVQLEKRLYNELCECVVRHEEIHSISKTLERCISPVAFGQFSVITLILCTSLYELAKHSAKSPIAAFASLMYLSCMLWQLFLYCWNGNELLVTSSCVMDAAYKCNWYNCSARFRESLRFLMRRSLRPIKIKAGSFIPISLETYVAIVRMSYSFFTLIKNGK